MTDAAALLLRHVQGQVERARPSGPCLTVGICGAQGCGKSTAVAAVAAQLAATGCATAVLSLDDLYLGHTARRAVAARVHPLFRTRGVPGTHEVALGISVLDDLREGRGRRLPRFDKAADDRMPQSLWPPAPAGVRVVLFEGWCIGARPQAEAELSMPINKLERREDPDGRWRRAVNAALAGPYQALFGRCDTLILLAAPEFGTVLDWRREQEQELRAARAGDGVDRTMDGAQLARFVQHYERLTRHILREMPPRSDLVVRLDRTRAVLEVDGA